MLTLIQADGACEVHAEVQVPKSAVKKPCTEQGAACNSIGTMKNGQKSS